MIADRITEYLNSNRLPEGDGLAHIPGMMSELAAHAFRRQFMEDGSRDYVGLSSCGKCARALAYKHLGFKEEGRGIDARAKTVFWIGDLAESEIVSLAK